jgi:threonine/homoserine/homoserine lactone efflux protein
VTTALLGFALASTLVILAPGPDSMLVMRNTLRSGRRAGWVTGIVLIGFGLRLATESRRFA